MHITVHTFLRQVFWVPTNYDALLFSLKRKDGQQQQNRRSLYNERKLSDMQHAEEICLRDPFLRLLNFYPKSEPGAILKRGPGVAFSGGAGD